MDALKAQMEKFCQDVVAPEPQSTSSKSHIDEVKSFLNPQPPTMAIKLVFSIGEANMLREILQQCMKLDFEVLSTLGLMPNFRICCHALVNTSD